MNRRMISVFLVFALLLVALALPCFAETEGDLSQIGSEVSENSGDYFLYGILIFAVIVLVALALVFWYKRRH